MNGLELECRFTEMGASQIINYADLPQFYTYTVTNGKHILAIGKAGTKQRIRSFFPGATGSAVHTKNFVVVAAHTLYGPNTILVKSAESESEARNLETQLEQNGFPKIFIDGNANLTSLLDVSSFFWELLKEKHALEVSETLNCCMKMVSDNGDILSSLLKTLEEESREFNAIVGGFFSMRNVQPPIVEDQDNFQRGDMPITCDITSVQILRAIQYLESTAGRITGLTKNFYIETSELHFVLEVEKPGVAKQLTGILAAFNGANKLAIGGVLTGRADGKQYHSGLSSCYLVLKSRGFNSDGGDTYFSR